MKVPHNRTRLCVTPWQLRSFSEDLVQQKRLSDGEPVTCVEEVYEAASASMDIFKELLSKATAGTTASVTVPPLKAQARVLEKARDDYLEYTPGAAPPSIHLESPGASAWEVKGLTHHSEGLDPNPNPNPNLNPNPNPNQADDTESFRLTWEVKALTPFPCSISVGPPVSYVYDVVRGSILCPDEDTILHVVKALLQASTPVEAPNKRKKKMQERKEGLESTSTTGGRRATSSKAKSEMTVLRLKNRFKNPTPGT